MADKFTRNWIITNSLDIIKNYEKGILTLRGLHYQLVSIGMTNTSRHYKRVVAALGEARWKGLVDFDVFSDNDREMIGSTAFEITHLAEEIDNAKGSIKDWMTMYYKNRWENQLYYPEIFIEKKALQGVFQSICFRNRVTLGACKGYPSLTFLNEAALRFIEAEKQGKIPIILYFGDYDPSGEDIPRSVEETIKKMGCENITVKRISLLHDQVVNWKLPPAPIKDGDSRSANWDGIGQVELDAVKPEKLQKMCQDAIDEIFDKELHQELRDIENEERETYRNELKKFITEL